jgi:hypothetical protein
MLVLDVPGRGQIQLSHLVLDLNGTLAVDGRVPESVAWRLRALSERLHLHVVTADTFGTAASWRGGAPRSTSSHRATTSRRKPLLFAPSARPLLRRSATAAMMP